MESLLPGLPVEAKAALLAGLAGGLFAAIVFSYAAPDWQYRALAIGIGVGMAGALALWLRSIRTRKSST